MLSTTQIPPIQFSPEVDLDAITLYKNDLLKFVNAVAQSPVSERLQLKRYYMQLVYQKWAPLLAVTPEHIQNDVYDVMYPPVQVVAEYTVQTALSRKDLGASWLIAGLLPRAGLQLLGAAPKVGKSVFLYMMAYSIAISGSFLGLPCKKGKVLYIQAEEPDDLISQRLRLAGFGSWDVNINDPDVANSVTIWRKFDALDPSDISKLQNVLSRKMYNVVFLDSLRKLTHKQAINENSNEMGRIVYTLQDVFSITNTAGILIHHMKKPTAGAANQSLVNMFSGHSSITAASDGLMGLFANEADGEVKSITLRTLPREGIPLKIEYERLVSDEGLWVSEVTSTTSLLGDSALLIKLLRIIKNPKYGSTGPSLRQVAETLNVAPNDDKLAKNIERLQSLRIILSTIHLDKENNDKRVLCYTLAADSEWLIDNPRVQEAVNKVSTDAENLLKCTSRPDLRALTEGWERTRKQQVMASLAPGEKEYLTKLFTTPQYSVGDFVYNGEKLQEVKAISQDVHLFKTKYVLDDGSTVYEQHLRPSESEISVENDADITHNDLDTIFED